jgi:hypothetical protein
MQLTLNFAAGIAESYETLREFIAFRIHQLGKPQKIVAADMDLQPSDLTRKLSGSLEDHRRFSIDDLERYIQVTGDTQPVYYLVEKYLAGGSDEIAVLERRIAQLRANKAATVEVPTLKARAGR